MASVSSRKDALIQALKIVESKQILPGQSVDDIAKEIVKAAKTFEEYITNGIIPENEIVSENDIIPENNFE